MLPRTLATLLTLIAAAATADDLAQKHRAVADQLLVAIRQQADQDAVAIDTGPAGDETRVDLLKQLDVVLAQQKAAAAERVDLDNQLAELVRRGEDVAAADEIDDQPVDIIAADNLDDSIDSLIARSEAIRDNQREAQKAIETAAQTVRSRGAALRLAKEREPDADHAVAQLELQLAQEWLTLRKAQARAEAIRGEIHELQLQDLTRRRDAIAGNVRFTQDVLDEQLAEIATRELELTLSAQRIARDLQYAERRWLTARQEVDEASSPTAGQLARVEALKTNQATIQLEAALTGDRLQRLPILSMTWKRRYLVASGSTRATQRREWLAEARSGLEGWQRDRRSRESKLADARSRLAGVTAAYETAGDDQAEVRRWLSLRREAINRQIELLGASVIAIEADSGAPERLAVQIQGRPGRGLNDWAVAAWEAITRIWNYELTIIEDTALTVGKVISTLLFLLLGYLAARWLSHVIASRLDKFGVADAGAHAIESLSFYALLIGFGLASLRYANVPLGVFTFLGGAIAIGIGFGSQNILNNFISGLILLAERPIKAGDLIDLDGTYGNVTKIGARSTQIRTGENTDIIVPNSKFLENNVINLTRLDDRLRTSIAIGVAYGSDLGEVVERLKAAAAEVDSVLDRPAPAVWFNDFGDNALLFQVNFWITARTVMQMRKAETEVRMAIDRHFREAGISIAFPQRDLHLHTSEPIDLRLVDSQSERIRRAA